MKVYENITELIGNTPLVRISKKFNIGNADILAKLESFNPSNSIKDRPAKAMLQAALNEGKINERTIIIEPTSGNMGIGLAMCAAQMGLKIILTMPESMSIERRKMLKGYGAQLVLTPASLGMQGAVDKAKELAKLYPNSFIPSQFENPYNPSIHECTTAEEIWKDTDGKIDILVGGFGTGGTLSGAGKRLKELKPEIKVIAVEPLESPLVTEGKAGPHLIQGIGANFVPQNLHKEYIDDFMTVSGEKAIETAKELAKKEGILTGISSGAAMEAALNLSILKENEGKIIVVILPDFGERYISTKLFEE